MTGRIHLYLPASADRSAAGVIDHALNLARTLKAELSVSIPRVAATAPAHWLAGEYMMAHLADLNARSADDAARLTAQVNEAARMADVPTRILASAAGVLGPDRKAIITARAYDLTIVGLPDRDSSVQQHLEEFLFDSGRPVVVLPLSRPVSIDLRLAVVAWDHTEPAARALLGALPLLRCAEQIQVITMRGAKRLPDGADAAEAVAYLQAHGLNASAETIDADDDNPGGFLMEAAIARGAGLLVMGAYSTLRAREYLLGGVTRGVLNAPLLPVMMAN